MFTSAQRAALVAHVQAEVVRARAAIDAADFHWWEGDAKAQQLGAVEIIASTTLPALQRLAAAAESGERDEDDADARLRSLARDAETSLSAIRGYAAEATLDDVLARTAQATAQDVAADVGKVANGAAGIVGGAVHGLLGALSWKVKVVGGVVVVGLLYAWARPALGIASIARKALPGSSK